MKDFLDRRATAWNRAWAIVTGLWLTLAGDIPTVGPILLATGVVTIVLAAGGLDLACAARDHHRGAPTPAWWDHLARRRAHPAGGVDDGQRSGTARDTAPASPR